MPLKPLADAGVDRRLHVSKQWVLGYASAEFIRRCKCQLTQAFLQHLDCPIALPLGCYLVVFADEVLQGPGMVHDELMGMTSRCVCHGHTSSSRLSTGSMLLVVEGFSSPRVARTPSETQCRNGLPMAGSKLTDTLYMSIRCTDAYSLKKMCCNTNRMVQKTR